MRACRSPWTPVRPNLHGAENAVNTRLQRTCRRLRVVRDSPRSASILAVSPPQAVPAAPLAETLLGNDGLHAHRDRVPLSGWERGWGEGPARSVSWCLRRMERSLHSHPSGWVTAAWHACAAPRSGRSHKPGTGSFHDPLRCLPQLGEKRRCPRGTGFSRDRHSRQRLVAAEAVPATWLRRLYQSALQTLGKAGSAAARCVDAPRRWPGCTNAQTNASACRHVDSTKKEPRIAAGLLSTAWNRSAEAGWIRNPCRPCRPCRRPCRPERPALPSSGPRPPSLRW
ncbi:hypothetical protein NB696_000392 [Xanthomonas sacchari]|nr:hypothetical protein [Xanthomonas sacchari]MCW0443520.1 hypothetical protein [Xanthomonas sacchari]